MKFKTIESGTPTSKQLSFGISSGEEEPENLIWLYLFNRYWYWAIDKQIIKPKTKWVDTSHYQWAKPGPDGRCGYTDELTVEYSFAIRKHSMSIQYGVVQDCWPNEYSTLISFPWAMHRQVSETFYSYDPKTREITVFETLNEKQCETVYASLDVEKKVPKFKVAFTDYDGTEVVATCHVVGRKWRRGVKWAKFVGWFQRAKSGLALYYAYNKEVGTEKGSWKGGTIGGALDIQIGQDPFEAFKVYAASSDDDKRPFTNVRLLEE